MTDISLRVLRSDTLCNSVVYKLNMQVKNFRFNAARRKRENL